MLNKRWIAYLLLLQIVVVNNICHAQNEITDRNGTSDSLQSALMDLKWSEKEVLDIDRLLHGKVFLHQNANEKNFDLYAKDANIIAVQVFSRFEDSLFEDHCGSDYDFCVKSYESDQMAGLDYIYDLRSTYSIASINMSLGDTTQHSSQSECNDNYGYGLVKVLIDRS